jgi:hypothetical protein
MAEGSGAVGKQQRKRSLASCSYRACNNCGLPWQTCQIGLQFLVWHDLGREKRSVDRLGEAVAAHACDAPATPLSCHHRFLSTLPVAPRCTGPRITIR